MEQQKLENLIYRYCTPGQTPGQGELGGLLRELQALSGGSLPEPLLEEVCRILSLKRSYLSAVMKYIPGLRTEALQHRLEICAGGRCKGALGAHIEKAYGVRPGEISARGRFSYKTCGCLKACKNGPCVRWDGQVYTRMTPEALDALIKKG